jgi:glyoxylase I family protein
MPGIRITELDHIVLNVNDIERSLRFYIDTLGLGGERIAEFREGKVGFPSVRINADTIIDLFPRKEPVAIPPGEKNNGNLNHFCMVVGADEFTGAVEHLKARGVAIREGPVARWGARGRATSIYFLDPDGNEIEIRCY